MPIRSPIRSPIQWPISLGLGGDAGGLVFPPVLDKLVAWLPYRAPMGVTHKEEVINGYHFLMQNCPPDLHRNALGELETNALGEAEYDTLQYIGWKCEYLAPASGAPGHTELLAIDDGTLYTGGVPNVLTEVEFAGLTNDQMFHCLLEGKGFLVYSEVLTGDELQAVSEFMVCPVAVVHNTIPVTHNGVPLIHVMNRVAP